MIRKKLFKLVLCAFLVLQMSTQAFADGQNLKLPRRPEPTPEQIAKLKELFESQEIQKKLQNPTKNRSFPFDPTPFQGWWQNISRGDILGFGEIRYGTATDDEGNYIFIDTQTYANFGFIQISTLAGTPFYPREFTNVDYGNTQTPQPFFLSLYYMASPTEIASIFELDGPIFDPTNGQTGWSVKLQPGLQSLCACFDSRPDFVGLGTFSNFFRKLVDPTTMQPMPPPQPIRPFDDTNSAFPDVTNPVAMAQYIYNAWTYNHADQQNIHYNDQDTRSFYVREAFFAQLLDEGVTFTTPIRRLRVSKPGEHYLRAYSTLNAPNGTFTSTDLVTDIFTDGFSYATTGSTVEIGGFVGPWARLNGTYVNGVATIEENAIPDPSPTHVDVNEDQTRGTFRNVYNHFLLDFDSSDMPHDEQGWALGICGNPYVRVTHRITADTEYPAFFAAIHALYYQMFQVSLHGGRLSGRFAPGSLFLFDTFQEMKDNVAAGTYWGNPLRDSGDNQISSRTGQAIPSGFFNNPVYAQRAITTYNDPFGLTQAPGSTYEYNIAMANYLDQSSIKNLYWAIAGTPDLTPVAPNGAPLQFDPVTVGYKPAIPGAQRAEFVGTLGDVTVVNGIPQPQFPAADPTGTYYTLFGGVLTQPFGTPSVLSNNYFVGIIDPALTNGKKVGYFRWQDEGLVDPFSYMPTSTFPPVAAQLPPSQGGTNLKYGREANSQVFSNYTRYFNQQGCDVIIMDIRTNIGGFLEEVFSVAEFCGADRAAYSQLWSKKDNGNSALINLADTTQYTFFQEVQAGNSASFARFYVSQNEATYGADTIFRGSPGHPKKIIILTDYAASSSGDAFPHLFLGENLDGDLGSFTTCTIIGDIDGRLKGLASQRCPTPVSEFSNQIYDELGRPFPPIKFTHEFAGGMLYNGITGIPYNIQTDLVAPSAAPSLQGTAGGNPLPNDWSTNTWPALGFIPPYPGLFDPRIPKGLPVANVPETARDPWLEQCIVLAAYSN